MSVNDDIFQARWKMSFPPEELDVRIMCGDPQAIAWNQIEEWLRQQELKPPVTMVDLINYLWYEKYGDGLTRFDIFRTTKNGSSFTFPGDMPPELDKAIDALFT